MNLPKTYRKKIINGVTIPGIIKNGKHFFSDFNVYEDGRVACWNFEDFEHFKKDVERGWVAVSIPDGEEISIHSLGSWTIGEGEWKYNKEDFIDYVWSIVQNLNPNLDNIYKHFIKKVNGITIAESGKGEIFKEKERHPNDLFPEKIKGSGVNLFYKNESNAYYLVRLDIFDKDSLFINRYPTPFEIDLAKFEKMIKAGNFLTEIPTGAKVHLFGLGSFKIKKLNYCTKMADKLVEIKDTIGVLCGESSMVDKCREVYAEYLKNPTPSVKEQLKIAYENVPEHEKMYVGDMDVKDTAVRMIIYGEDEIEGWSHYQVAKASGMKLPTIKIPKPEEE